MIGDELKNYTWINLMNMAMGQISDNVDKSQGSIIYDALTPAITCLSVLVEQMRMVYYNTFIATAQGEYLDLKVEELGLSRIEATQAVRRVNVYDTNGNLMDIEIGSMVTPRNDSALLYTLTERESAGVYKAVCSAFGIVGNEYIGECDVISNVTNIGNAYMSDVITSARDDETDEELRQRAKESLEAQRFGGNIADYRGLVGNELPEVGKMQVYPRSFTDPVTDGIVLSVLDPSGNVMSQEQLTAIQEKLDPSTYPGQGTGIVPIGHHPKVVSPIEVTTNFSMTITPRPGRTVDELKSQIEEKISAYIDTLRSVWADLDTNYGYTLQAIHAQVVAEVLKVDGVINVTNVLINGVDGETGHYDYEESKAKQEIPVLGTITLNNP